MISHLVYALNKPFLSQVLRSKIEFVNLSSLHQIYSPEILNKELGGKLIDINYSDKWYLELVRAEILTCTFWDKFCTNKNSNLDKSTNLNDEIDKSDNNLLNSQHNGCNGSNSHNLPSFLTIIPSCSDYFLPTPVYK